MLPELLVAGHKGLCARRAALQSGLAGLRRCRRLIQQGQQGQQTLDKEGKNLGGQRQEPEEPEEQRWQHEREQQQGAWLPGWCGVLADLQTHFIKVENAWAFELQQVSTHET